MRGLKAFMGLKAEKPLIFQLLTRVA